MKNNIINYKYSKDVLNICRIMDKNNFEIFIVGGAIRDIAIGRHPKDFDFTTNALPGDILKMFKNTIPTGIKHGTITVLFGKSQYEITTYRSDGEYQDFRHPNDVSFNVDINQDLCRRDFTINSICYNPINSKIIDNHGGLLDIENKTVKAIGDSDKRFNEDALRMIRAIGFACKLSFTIETDTYKSILDNAGLISKVSKERINNELCKILKVNARYGIGLLIDTKLFNYIFPNINFNSNIFFKDYLLNIANILKNHDYKTVMKDLKFSNKEIEIVKDILTKYECNDDYDIVIMIGKLKNNLYRNLVFNDNLSKLKYRINYLFVNKYPIFLKDLDIDGNDLIKMGIGGKDIGDFLIKIHREFILNFKVENNKKEYLVNLLNILLT